MSTQFATPSDATPPLESTLPKPLREWSNRAPSLARAVQFLWRLGERWSLDKCALMAAAMAFYGLLSLFPILLAALAILGKTLANRADLRDQLLGFAKAFLPTDLGNTLISGEVQKLAATNTTAIGVFSILSLLWSGRAFFRHAGECAQLDLVAGAASHFFTASSCVVGHLSWHRRAFPLVEHFVFRHPCSAYVERQHWRPASA
jgi:hypothetical protein